ncbi:MAG TPA: 23S rRNA (guanosine(2251)-2'-O)-methyltransferase RlmB [Alphaproteobacteria bacterium]
MKNFRPKNNKSPRNAPKGNFRKDDARKDRPRNNDRPKKDDVKAELPKKEFKRFNRDDHDNSAQRLTGPVLYGFHAVRAAILNPARRVLRILGTDEALDEFRATMDAAKEADLKRPNVETIDKVKLDRMLPTGAVHQGIAATVETLATRDASDLVGDLDRNEKAVFVILDQVTDPHNIGAILRSAAAFGAKGVIMQDRHTPDMTGVVAKVASGAVDVVPIALETNLSRCIEMLQDNDFFVIGLDERGDDIGDLPDYDRVALVLGAEGDGIRRLVAEHCDKLVSLPTQGQILSLNVSNAAAVALYATRHKN